MKPELWKYDEIGGLNDKERKEIKKYPKGLTEQTILKIIQQNGNNKCK